MKYDLVIWDFNGTLTDDVAISIDSVNTLLSARGLNIISSLEEYRSLFSFPIRDYYVKLGFDFSKESYDTVAKEWMDEYVSRMALAGLTPHAKETLKKISDAGIEQIILSTSEVEMLERLVSLHGIRKYFSAVLGLDNIYGGGKTEMAKKWADGKTFRALFVGDTVHDFDTAKAIGADCILYSGGHDSREKLLSRTENVVDDIRSVFLFAEKTIDDR